MKRLLSFILVLILIMTSLVSCLKDDNDDDGDTPGGGPEAKTDTQLITERIEAYFTAIDTADTEGFLACYDARTRNTMNASLNLVGGFLNGIDMRDLLTLSFSMMPSDTISVSVSAVEINGTSAKATANVTVGTYGPYPTYFYMVKENGGWYIERLEDPDYVAPEDETPKPYFITRESFMGGYAYVYYTLAGEAHHVIVNTDGDVVYESDIGYGWAGYGEGIFALWHEKEVGDGHDVEIRKADGSLILSSKDGAFDQIICGGDGYVALYKKEATMTSVTHKLGVLDKNGTWVQEMTDVADVMATLGGEFDVVYRGEGFFSFYGPSSKEIYFNVSTGDMLYFEDISYMTDTFVDGVIFAAYGYKLNDPSEFSNTPDERALPNRYALYSDGTVHKLPQWDMYDENFAEHYGSVFVIENDDYFMIFDGKTKTENYFEYGEINSELVMGVEFYGEVGVVRIRGLDEKYYYALIDVEGNITKELAEIPEGADNIIYCDGYLIYTDDGFGIHFTSVSDPTKTVKHEHCTVLYGFGEDKISKIGLGSDYLYIKPDGTLFEINLD